MYYAKCERRSNDMRTHTTTQHFEQKYVDIYVCIHTNTRVNTQTHSTIRIAWSERNSTRKLCVVNVIEI